MARTQQSGRKWITLLVVATWLPLGLIALGIGGSENPQTLSHIAVAYGAAVLCFLGGVRFGSALMSSAEAPWIVKLTPLVALLGLGALYLPNRVALAVLFVGFAAQGALDSFAGMQGRLPPDYSRSRTMMTWLWALTLLAILLLSGRS